MLGKEEEEGNIFCFECDKKTIGDSIGKVVEGLNSEMRLGLCGKCRSKNGRIEFPFKTEANPAED